MEQDERVYVSYGKTVNTGNYESARLDVRYASDLYAGETVHDAITRVKQVVESEVNAWIESLK